MQTEKAKHADTLKGVRETHARELSNLRAELNQQQEREREREDDSSRVHDELLAVRSELAQARADSERAYHDQLLPTQVPIPYCCYGARLLLAPVLYASVGGLCLEEYLTACSQAEAAWTHAAAACEDYQVWIMPAGCSGLSTMPRLGRVAASNIFGASRELHGTSVA